MAKNRPLPYLLYGPPGTGKTATLVTAIEIIVKCTDKNILVCANSNAACDEIADRLVDLIRDNEVLRMYARSYDESKLSERIDPISNWFGGEFCFPSLQTLVKFRVVICTLCTVSNLTRSGIGKKPNHFSYIIIDECASTHETMAMVAVAGICSTPYEIHSSIIVAGDPKQLDAVTKSDDAIGLGFKISLMEQLMKLDIYQRDPITKEFNPMFMTQLVKNYRSHAAILKIPNKLFYDNSLEAKASDGQYTGQI